MAYNHSYTAEIALNLANRADLPVLSQVAIRFANTVAKWADRYKSRRDLSTMTPERLKDIGITEYDAYHESRKSFWRE
ncbi:DUF1127 domain-containing protein [Amylibacter sp. SFDW26]|uniref:DUF1127 domain-containing protein n=1 Tax=Amylibacter sp. SFDW26 TaxID=2652722 RepID=UPI00186A0D3A|nr:DUF1127 domain-containing protein [Amylibacter sp. SFDW26]